MPAVRGARPIRNMEVLDFHDSLQLKDVSLDEYTNTFREWINYSEDKSLKGLDQFKHAELYTGH